MSATVSIGVAGALGPAAIARIAGAAEAAGLHAVWVNDTPGGDSLAALSAAASATDTLTLATGVIPIDRRGADDIVAAAAGLPGDRLVLGIGSGQLRRGVVDRTRDVAGELRGRTGGRVMVGALGPRMRQMAAVSSDGVVLNWLTPGEAAAQTAQAHADRSGAHTALYVRTALDAAALPRLREETARYAGYPAYAANFARMGVDAGDTVLTPDSVADRLPAYRGAADEIVLRAITPADDVDAYLSFVAEAAALVG